MIPAAATDTFATTSFRTIGYAGAGLFTIAPPTFLYEIYLIFYTTAVEDNPTIGLFMALSLVLSFVSIPLMMVGRRTRYSVSPTVAVVEQPGAL